MAGDQDHPPLFADEQEQKHNQACDERQADPDNGPGVVAGPWGRKAGWGDRLLRPRDLVPLTQPWVR